MPDSDLVHLAETLRPALLRLSRQLRRESQRLGLSPLDAMLLGLIHKLPAPRTSPAAGASSHAAVTVAPPQRVLV